MPEPTIDRATLRDIVHQVLRLGEINQTGLALACGLSKSTLSQWLNDKYPADPREVEMKLAKWIDATYAEAIPTLSMRDEHIMTQVLALLQSADNGRDIITTIARFTA